MGRFIDMTGWKMWEHGVPDSRLVVIGRAADTKDGKPRWLCECTCKKHNRVVVIGAGLRNGTTKSCGCLASELSRERAKKYNTYHEQDDYIVGETRTTDYEFYIDKKYYDLIHQYCWHKHQDGYLRTCIGQKENGGNIYKLMHVMIMEAEGHIFKNGEEVDHINGKPNDNRVENLRITTHAENMKNVKLPNNNTSGFKGVYYSKRERKWKAMIRVNKQQRHLGTFDTKEEAIIARQNAENLYYGKYKRKEKDLYNGTRQNDYEVKDEQ